jgi:hypothetical protein
MLNVSCYWNFLIASLSKRNKRFFGVTICVYLFTEMSFHRSNKTRAKCCACKASFASTQIGAHRAENTVQ